MVGGKAIRSTWTAAPAPEATAGSSATVGQGAAPSTQDNRSAIAEAIATAMTKSQGAPIEDFLVEVWNQGQTCEMGVRFAQRTRKEDKTSRPQGKGVDLGCDRSPQQTKASG